MPNSAISLGLVCTENSILKEILLKEFRVKISENVATFFKIKLQFYCYFTSCGHGTVCTRIKSKNVLKYTILFVLNITVHRY